MVGASKGQPSVSAHGRWQWVSQLLVAGLVAALGFGGVLAWSGCGGGDACQACRDDCIKNNIPLPDCNCKGSCPGT